MSETANEKVEPVPTEVAPAKVEATPPAKVEAAAPVVVAEVAKPAPVAYSPEQVARWQQAERDRDALRAAEDLRIKAQQEAEEARLKEEGKLNEVIANKDKALAERDQKLRESDTRFRATTRDRELAVALSSHKLTDGSATQLMKLWRDDLVTVEDGETWKVQSRDGKPVETYVAENLAHADYSKFVVPVTKGGSPPSKAGNAPPPDTGKKPDAEQRQVNSLKESLARTSFNPLAGSPSNRG